MEAPVPASALIHSATLVSAGVFILLRFAPMLELSSFFNTFGILIGATTAMYGGVTAAFQTDVKKILAFSTISHCGFLIVTTTFFNPNIALYYLYIHGFAKATVFLCFGNVIRFNKNGQDYRRMGGFFKYLPFECLISLLCL